MPNGRALPSALLFDWLLGRAWNMAQNNYAKGAAIAEPGTPGVLKPNGEFSVPRFSTRFTADAGSVVTLHDAALNDQLREIADMWAAEFSGVMTVVAPVGPGFNLAVQWLRDVMTGKDGLGYLGQDKRAGQAQGYATTAASGLNQRKQPMPPGAAQALQALVADVTSMYTGRLAAQMDADRIAELQKLNTDAVEMLVKLRNDALDAAMDMMFMEMTLMYDVFGNNNNFLTDLRRHERAMSARVQACMSELSSWDAKVAQNFDGAVDGTRRIKAVNDRGIEKAQLTVEQHVRRLRKYAQRSASVINSAGVSVQSSARESNKIRAD